MCCTATSLGWTHTRSRLLARRGSISSGSHRACSRALYRAGGWPTARCSASAPGRNNILRSCSLRPERPVSGPRWPRCWRWPDSSSPRPGLGDATPAPGPSAVRIALVGRRGASTSIRDDSGPLRVLAALCANLHGSFALFPLVVGLAWLEDRRRKDARASRTLLIAVVTAVATLANPFGPRVWTYAVRPVDQPRHPRHDQRVDAADPRDGPRLVRDRVRARGGRYLVPRKQPTPWTALVTLALFFLLALSAQRAIVWWGMVAPVVLAGLVAAGRGAVRPSAPQGLARPRGCPPTRSSAALSP